MKYEYISGTIHHGGTRLYHYIEGHLLFRSLEIKLTITFWEKRSLLIIIVVGYVITLWILQTSPSQTKLNLPSCKYDL